MYHVQNKLYGHVVSKYNSFCEILEFPWRRNERHGVGFLGLGVHSVYQEAPELMAALHPSLSQLTYFFRTFGGENRGMEGVEILRVEGEEGVRVMTCRLKHKETLMKTLCCLTSSN